MPNELKIIIDAEIQPAETKIKSFGKVVTAEFGKITNAATGLSQGITTSVNKINSSLASLKVTSIDLSIDTSSIDSSIKSIQSKFSVLANPEVNIFANTEQAEAKVKELLAELATLKGSEIFIRANDTQALKVINEVEAELNSLIGKKLTIDINASKALAEINGIEKQIKDLQGLKIAPNVSATQLALFEKNIDQLKVKLASLKGKDVGTFVFKANAQPAIKEITSLQAKVIDLDRTLKSSSGFNSFQSALGKSTASISALQTKAAGLNNFYGNLAGSTTAAAVGFQKLGKDSVIAGKATENAFNKAFTGVKQLANIIPGLGISSLIFIAVDALVSLATQFFKTSEAATKNSSIIAESGKEYQTAVANVGQLKTEIGLAKDGFISKDAVVKHYNETIGKTTGFVKSLDEAEQALNKNADAYIKFTLLKAAANVAQGKAAEQVFNKALQEQKDFERNFIDFGKRQATGKGVQLTATDVGQGDLTALQKQQLDAQKKTKDIFDKRIKGFEDIAKDFNTQAALIASSFKFDFFGDQKGLVSKDQTDAVLARARQFVKEFGDVFVVPDLTETFFKGIKQILPNAKKLLEDIKIGDLKIKIPKVEFELLPDAVTPLTSEQLEDLTKRFFSDVRPVEVPLIIDPTIQFAVDQGKLKDALKDAISKGNFSAALDLLQKIDLNPAIEGVQGLSDSLKQSAILINDTLAPAFQNLFDAIIAGKNPLKAFFDSLKDSITQVIKKLIAAAVQAAILSAITGGASGALGGFGKIFKGLLGLGGAAGGTANFNLGGAIGSRSFQNTLNVVVSGSISGSTINLAGQRAANSSGRFG